MFPKRRKIASEEGETSSAIFKNDYEVFLSFRGPDTRQGFTDCLYYALIDSGISVFRDDDELPVGVKINEILIAIENSKICIVVLSPTFAESAWCLREIEKMVDTKKYIVPIFCDVTPDDVKLKTELYTNYLMVLEEKYGKAGVQRWRDALKELTTIKGWELKDTGYGKFIKLVVQEILTKLRVKHKYEIKNLVQVPDEVESALEMLDIKCPRRRILTISGMGGIGKTTLAKIIFDEILDNFDCSCFLDNIREHASQGRDALRKLQKRLLKSLNPSMKGSTRIVDPMKMTQTAFQRKKVIIVLDDVDEQSHLDYLVGDFSWFGFGSRIIFTTRNARLHGEANSSNADLYRLEKQEMDSKQALKLFSRHAFGEDFPPKNFKDLSTEAISTTGGLPLALEVIGSLLHRRKVKVWRETIKKLKESPHQDVQRKLRLSYDALESEQQEIFLDIACFFIGIEKANAIYMWEACEFYPIDGIEALISLSLIKLSEKKCFQMHDQLRDLGRAIVKVKSTDAKAGSRLWMREDALDLLKGNGEKEKVEALSLEGPSDYLSRENFIGLEKLRFLRLIKCTNLHGDFGKLIPKVRWLSILYASNFAVTNLCLRELVVLELSSIRFDDTWSGWAQILISQHLKVLTLLWCPELVSTPDLSKIVNLERLVLEKCEKLNSLHSSVGKLQCLRRLSILHCSSFRELPEKLYALGSLKQIRLSYPNRIGVIPPLNLSESINRLVVLTRLELEHIFNLPNSIGELVNLKHIRLGHSPNLKVLPNSIGDLRSLVSLIMSDVGITELPTTIGQLAKLEILGLVACGNLKRLPDSIVNLHSLIDLHMDESYSVVEYPDSFRSLEKLELLSIGSAVYWIRKLPDLPSRLTWLCIRCVEKIQNLSNLINLSVLEIHNFGSEAAQPVQIEGIENLLKLKRLSIKCVSVQSLSMEWGALHQLKKLKLHCFSLQFGLCELPLNLESLDLEVKRWVPLSFDLSRLKNLAKLKLWNFIIKAFEGPECLEYLEMWSCILHFSTFLAVKRIRNLCLYNCSSQVTSLADDQLSIIGSDLPIQLSNLKNLSKLKLAHFLVPENGFKAVGVGGLEFLVDLRMEKCTLFECTDNLALLRNLRSLHLEECSFPPLGCLHIPQLGHLVELDISICGELVEIQGIGKLKSLTRLCIYYCDMLRWIEDFYELKGLAEMKIIGCSEFDRRGGRGEECNASII